ncbi:MAG: hypothetical protein JNK87_35940 [Bryobacterales bacterium]|nr:hypothetical protein [Bryobacterales bacterium]
MDALLTLTQLKEVRFGCTSIGVGIEGQRFATVSMMSVNPRRLEKMKGFKNLQRLQLQGCDRVDDEGAQILATFPNLEQVDLKGTAVTEKGLAALRAAKPKLKINHGPLGRQSRQLPQQLSRIAVALAGRRYDQPRYRRFSTSTRRCLSGFSNPAKVDSPTADESGQTAASSQSTYSSFRCGLAC